MDKVTGSNEKLFSRKFFFLPRTLLMIILLIGSVLAIGEAFFNWNILDKEKAATSITYKNETTECSSQDRYEGGGENGGGKLIPLHSATGQSDSAGSRQSWMQFLEEQGVPINEHQYGVWLSKKALDHLFANDCNANGIYAYYTIGEDRKFNVIFQAGHQHRTELDLTERIAPGDMIFFEAESYCPIDCGY